MLSVWCLVSIIMILMTFIAAGGEAISVPLLYQPI